MPISNLEDFFVCNKLTMAEKDFSDAPVTHDEKITTHHEPDLAEATGRRASVALNIVENPLKVSFPASPRLVLGIQASY